MADPTRKKGKASSKAKDNATISDKRFANIQSDPRYRLPSKRHTHVKLDNRFAHMLRDKDFSRNAAVDRYGRKLARDDTKKQLERFYRLEDENADDASEASVDDDDDVLKELERVNKKDYDPARDGGFSESSSEESSSEEEDEDEEEDAEEQVDDAEFPTKRQPDVPLGEVTNRIAVVNLDWDNIRAEDIMAVFSSFATGGRILQVSIYPSEFGKERMEREEMEGPPKEIFASKHDEDEELDDEENLEDSEDEDENIKKSIIKEDQGEEFNTSQLRRYQIERLRYFYAIVEFSSKATAKQVYDSIDGTEYLSSANFFDLRFVPDDTDFSDDKPREQCQRIPDGYRPTDFVTDALQHSKVKLTWDADDKARKEAQAKAFRGGRKEIEENDLKAYLASDSSEDEEEEVEVVDTTAPSDSASKPSKKETERQRMRALLGLKDGPAPSSKEKGPVGDMEITFTSGLAGEPARESVFENEPEETTVEKYIRKQRERKQRRKEKLKASKRGEAGTTDNANDDQPQQTNAAEEDLGFDDPFFNEPEAKVTTSQRKEERRKKREEKAAEEAAAAAKRAELELLMVDDQSTGMKHFDMNEIEKAEKRARKKGKKGKTKQGDDQQAGGDDFQMDTADPRFTSLYESHEFAIDPTNPKFKATSGMRALLEESRKRRRIRDNVNDDEPVEESKKRRKGASKQDEPTQDVDLKKLLERVKSKTKKA